MDNISNNNKVAVGIINYLVDIVKCIAVLLYFSFMFFWVSFEFLPFSLMTISSTDGLHQL